MRQILLITGGVIASIALTIGAFTFNQVNKEEAELTARLEARSQILSESLAESILPSVQSNATTSVEKTIDKFVGNQRLAGLAVFDNSGAIVASSDNTPDVLNNVFVGEVMDAAEGKGMLATADSEKYYIFVVPIFDQDGLTIGALATIQNANYIDTTIFRIWRDNIVRFLLQTVLISSAIFALVRWVFFKPLYEFAESVKAARRGEELEASKSNGSFFQPLASEITKMTGSLRQARLAASEEARLRLEKIDTPWTAERLKEFTKAHLKDRSIFVVSNREPYIHEKIKNEVKCKVPAGGLVTALEPVMEATGGMWIAHGSGNADKETVDENDTIAVPPDEPRYTLKRIWLTDEDVQGYYNGVSNEALWPLCLMAHTRPLFRKEDWAKYRKVNGLFAKTILKEIQGIERPIVLVQDYHLALLPAMIKRARPDTEVAIFWHIPWPSASQFSICPWRKELLEGMLGADLVGFHTQQYCNNFMDTVASEIEARIDYERFAVTREGHVSFIKAFPISIAFTGQSGTTQRQTETLRTLGITTTFLGLGVDRLDYTKGILERFKGLEFFLRAHPEYKEKFTFLQIAAPSRESVPKYREYAAAVEAEAERVNTLFGTRTWKPIVLELKHYSHAQLQALYKLADVCLITSLHDGMNLVAKEYTAARDDEAGVLVLSQFTGASRSLKGALLINPYSAEETADAIFQALSMPKTEQHRRMKAMRASVRDYNVYRWSAELIKTLAELD